MYFENCWWDRVDALPVGSRVVLVRDTAGALTGTMGRISGPEGAHMSINGVLAEVLLEGTAEPTTLNEADFRPVD